MQVERIEEMRLTQVDEEQIGALLDRAFGADYEGRSYYQQRHHVRLIMRAGTEILGHIALSLRAIRMDEQIVQVAGLAEVGTDPHYRGKGIATKLMAAAIQEARASVASFVVLFGDQPLYAGSGFMTKRNILRFTPFIDVRTVSIKEVAKEGLMIWSCRGLVPVSFALIDLAGHAF